MPEIFRDAALAAGRVILDLRKAGCPAGTKADNSPVTEADHAAEAVILDALRSAFPDTPWLAEEACAAGHAPRDPGDGFFLVDPLDGTREFIAGRDEFTVNIAYVRHGRPLVGLVHAPALHETFVGTPDGAWRQDEDGRRRAIAARKATPGSVTALISRSHLTSATRAWLAATPPDRLVEMGSSLKFCRLAEGRADLYPCLGPTMEWDTAAGEAVLVAAGGRVGDTAGAPLAYGRTDAEGRAILKNPHFIACGRAAD